MNKHHEVDSSSGDADRPNYNNILMFDELWIGPDEAEKIQFYSYMDVKRAYGFELGEPSSISDAAQSE